MMETYAEAITRPINKCSICGNYLSLAYTDRHGEARCQSCGAAYYVRDYIYDESELATAGVQKRDIKLPYLTHRAWSLRHLYTDYWNDTSECIPDGLYLGRRPDEGTPFYKWLYANREKYSESYADYYHWDVLEDEYGNADDESDDA